ncbi:hypothetical protein NPX13_g680 [Xylaria arbuscula]|uniref:Uncharacterized protein n=1 Tax=Xylaria arbuscula TaxID=114810 RepID=A0A9W8TSC2_9PEZI|nr:hypothetical protein NPX13_g680 [Xylaria arbuscula]
MPAPMLNSQFCSPSPAPAPRPPTRLPAHTIDVSGGIEVAYYLHRSELPIIAYLQATRPWAMGDAHEYTGTIVTIIHYRHPPAHGSAVSVHYTYRLHQSGLHTASLVRALVM